MILILLKLLESLRAKNCKLKGILDLNCVLIWTLFVIIQVNEAEKQRIFSPYRVYIVVCVCVSDPLEAVYKRRPLESRIFKPLPSPSPLSGCVRISNTTPGRPRPDFPTIVFYTF